MAKERINPATLSRAAAYTQVVTADGGKLVFLAGQTPIDTQGQVVGVGDLRAQATQVYTNIRSGLAAAGASYSDVVKMTAYIVNYNQDARGIVGEVRRQFVPDTDLPAHTLLGVQALAREEFLIEVDTIAVVDLDRGSRRPSPVKRAVAGGVVVLLGAAVTQGIRRLRGKRR
ncbi:MAG TPA: RidA family protein [Dehalococcoidia bacterium]|nr:RidA family protein [Dehalococcoidia bacterium]